MAASFFYDDSLWPMLVCRFEGQMSDEDYEEYLLQGEFYLRRGEPYVSVLDTMRLTLPTARQRQRLFQWLRQYERPMRELVVGCAFIVTSPLIRLTMSTVFHVMPMPTPYVAVQDMARAVTWAADRMRDVGHAEAAAGILERFHL
ncbi:hypothetical protein F0U60_36955 [Archangium minus]|uniref:STAS/SEC14 domain-containing protein n=1 Tax=Archangium minus TaxID=83450 RepID=A0ABY9X132_9BACT|nr:hypothetical protein F0U61_36840 [Archangium violaceum]WNG49091.1 hypothetical protein F0U60_36955 [Archangium minus]